MDDTSRYSVPPSSGWARFGLTLFGFHLPVAAAYWAFCEGPFFHLYLFAAAILLSTLLPGLAILGLFRVELAVGSRLGVATAVGVVLLAAAYYLLGWAGWLGALLPLIALGDALFLWTSRRRIGAGFHRPPRIDRSRVPLIAVLLLVFAMVVWVSYPSGRSYDDGLRFYGTHSMDSIWHLAKIGELSHTVPPQSPTRADTPMQYHVLFHCYIAAMEKLTGIGALDLFFRLIPTLLIPLIALGAYTTVHALTRRPGLAALAVLMLFTAGDLAYFFVARKASEVGWANLFVLRNRGDIYYELQSFFGNHFAYLLGSATSIIGFALLFAALRLLVAIVRAPKPSAGTIVVCGLLFGAVVQSKVQLGAIGLTALGVAAAAQFLRSHQKRLLATTVVAGLFAGLFALPLLGGGERNPTIQSDRRSELSFMEKTTGERMVQQAFKLPGLNLYERVDEGTPEGWAIGLPLALLCFFGVRLVGLPAMVRSLREPEVWPVHLFMLTAIALGLVVPFIRVNEPATVSHFVVGGLFINIYFAIALWTLWSRRPAGFGQVVAVGLVIAAIPMAIFTLGCEAPGHSFYARVSPAEQLLYTELQARTEPEDRIVRPFDGRITLYRDGRPVAEATGDQFLGALARRRVLIVEGKIYPPIAVSDWGPIAEQVDELYRTHNPDRARTLLRDLRVQWLVVPAERGPLRFKTDGLLTARFSNAYGTLYTVQPGPSALGVSAVSRDKGERR